VTGIIILGAISAMQIFRARLTSYSKQEDSNDCGQLSLANVLYRRATVCARYLLTAPGAQCVEYAAWADLRRLRERTRRRYGARHYSDGSG